MVGKINHDKSDVGVNSTYSSTLGYDIIEWIATQEWANGKVGMYGASAFAMVQWLVAAENPPSLAVGLPSDTMFCYRIAHSFRFLTLGNSTL